MSNGREQLLQTIRAAVAAGNGGAAAPHPERDGVGRQGAGADPVACFCREFAAAGGHAHRAADDRDAVALVLSQVRAAGGRRVLVGDGLVMAALQVGDALRRTGFETVSAAEAERAEAFAADVGVTGVDYLIAETGSVVLLSRPGQPRSFSLLPPVHIAVARRGRIVADLFDLFEGSLSGGNLPACVSLITGPSKTGDIELKLVTGVHGPGAVHVVIV